MQTKPLNTLVGLCLLSIQLLTFSSAFAKSGGSMDGGGGDPYEERVDEIRSDILKWIEKGGAKNLVLPEGVTYQQYELKMKSILEPQKVIVAFIEVDDKEDVELQVSVDGIPKTCRGFKSEKDFQFHILCKISRFKGASPQEQYKLIHHEYAGLMRLETNMGAASDYKLSSQLTDYLELQTVLKLAVKSPPTGGKYFLPNYDVPFSTFGKTPFNVLDSKTNCSDIKNPDTCIIPDETDVQEEIDLFSQNAGRRLKTVKERIESLKVTAEKIKELAGLDSGLKSYKFYVDAAERIANLPQTDKNIQDALRVFNLENSTVVTDFYELKNMLNKYQGMINAQDNETIINSLKINRNNFYFQKITQMKLQRNYGSISLLFFVNEQKFLNTSVYNKDDNRKSDLTSYTQIKDSCGGVNFILQNIAISTAAQNFETSYLTLLDDHALLKNILDSGTSFTYQCEEAKSFLRKKKASVRYHKATNTLTNEYTFEEKTLFYDGNKVYGTSNLVQSLRELLK